MPVRMITSKIIEIGTSLFVIIGSGHYDLPARNIQPIVQETTTAVQTIAQTAFTTATAAKTSASESVSDQNKGYNLTASTISVSCIKLAWNGDENEEYIVTLTQLTPDDYIDNVYFEFKSNTLCYVTGLRENTAYQFDISDSDDNILDTTTGKTETVEIIEEFAYEDGWTNCFSYENAKGLTANPSWSAIQGAVPDSITDTGIMRDEYGDYCCAMGTYYGYCGDRFLVVIGNFR